MITPGEVLVTSTPIFPQVTTTDSVVWVVWAIVWVVWAVVWGTVTVGTGSVVACVKGVWPELCSSVAALDVVGALNVAGALDMVGVAVGLVLASVEELWLVLTEAEATSGGVVERDEGDETRA